MKKLKYGKSNAKRFFSGKGFYTALAISLVAVGCATWIGVNSTLEKLKKDPTENLENMTASQIPDKDNEWNVITEDVNKPQSNVTSSSTDTKPKQEVQLFISPLAGKTINPFSGDEVVKSKTLNEWRTHTGIDLAAKIGTPVKAIASGKITSVSEDAMWGTRVTITHPNAYVSIYSNLKTGVNVKQNQEVKIGDVIGVVGDSAKIEEAEEEHLHFEVMQNGNFIDPLSLLDK